MKKKRVVIIPSRDIEVFIVNDMNILQSYLKEDVEIIRLHYKQGIILPEIMNKSEMKEMYEKTGYDYTDI